MKTIISLEFLRIILSNENSNKDFEKRVAEVILSTLDDIKDKPSIEKILYDGECIFGQYIDAVIRSNEDYKNYYNKRSETESLCERFCKSLDDYTRESMSELSKQIANFISETYKPMTDIFGAIGQMVVKACESANIVSKQFADVVQRTSNFTEDIKQFIVPVLESISRFQENTLKKLGEAVISWNELDWNGLETSYRKWGEYGWTLIGHAPLSVFANEPISEIVADKLALKFYNKTGLENLFDELRKLHINKKILNQRYSVLIISSTKLVPWCYVQ